MRATSPTSPTDDHHSEAMASTEGQSYPDGREGGREGVGGWVGRCVCVGLGGVTANLCRRRKENRLWQNILKALLGDDWLIAPSPITRHRHRQQVHFIHLYDNIYIVLTVGAPLFCQNQQSNKNRGNASSFGRCVSFTGNRHTHGRKRK